MTIPPAPPEAPEFPRPQPVEDLKDGDRQVRIEATTTERRALADRLGIEGLEAFSADMVLRRDPGGRIAVSGSAAARLTQVCAVSAEPFSHDLAFRFDRLFASAAEAAARAGEPEFDPDEDDPPDAIVDGTIDLGEVAAEELALRIDPFARRPGAVFEPPADAEAPADGPFAALGALKHRGR